MGVAQGTNVLLTAGRSHSDHPTSSRQLATLRWLSATALGSSLLAAAPAFAQATSGGTGGSASSGFVDGAAGPATAPGSDGRIAPAVARAAGGGGSGVIG